MRAIHMIVLSLALTACVMAVGYGVWKGEFRETWYNGATL